MSLTTEEKAKIVQDFQGAAQDTGSVDVQIALLTHRINKLTGHFKQHIHDFHSRRGLLKLVSRRRKLLSYLRKKDIQKFRDLTSKLGIRVKSQG